MISEIIPLPLNRSTYWLTRFLILRLLGLVYFFAFFSLAQQFIPLLGQNGLTPVSLFLNRFQEQTGSKSLAFMQLPSIFWFLHSDGFMTAMAWIGVVLSLLVAVGFANGILMFILWFLYMSFVHIGQDWYSYGWEIQLLETGFLAIFLVPILDLRPFPKTSPPIQVIWLFRWLIFRIMVGAGLIKLRGDPCWRDLTCLKFHYETQPIPNPLSPYFHFMPLWFHKIGALFNFASELVAPFFIVWGRPLRIISGITMALLQCLLVLSGNLSFLNWLTLVPILSCFDDSFWALILPSPFVVRASLAAIQSQNSSPSKVAPWAITALVIFLSFNPVSNLLSPGQQMNTSFDPFNLVNTYGAFGTVGRERLQLVFEGTSDQELTPETQWRPFIYKCQPVDLYRRPCFCSPYQYRLDWQVWFAAMSEPTQYPWIFNLVWKLLHNDPRALSLFESNPFPGEAPHYIRIRLFKYQFAPLNHPHGQWWTRTDLGIWLPPLWADNPRLQKILLLYGWL